MNTSQSAPHFQSTELRGILDDALRYWERRRIPYNLVLVAVVVAWAVTARSHFHLPLWGLCLLLFVMAALANVLYSAAYGVDILIQRSSFRDLWRRRRWILWVAGMLLAVALANVWIIGQIN
ncbi:MAG: hypothetical protein WA876_15505 [Candidatus Acidiferrales bacterium]